MKKIIKKIMFVVVVLLVLVADFMAMAPTRTVAGPYPWAKETEPAAEPYPDPWIPPQIWGAEDEPQDDECRVLVDGLRLRTSPDGPVLDLLSEGVVLNVVGQEGNWLEVGDGWVWASLCR